MIALADFETASREVARRAFREAIVPERPLRVSAWAAKHRRLSSKESAHPGRWKNSATPYLVEIMDNLSPGSGVVETVFLAGAQLGKTETGNNFIAYQVDHAPGPAILVLPTVEVSERVSKQRLAPMIRSTPRLRAKIKDPRSRDSENTIRSKSYPGGILILAGANSAAGLRSMPMRYAHFDEIDAYPDDVDGEGDPIELAEARLKTYGRRKRILKTSTPTTKGFSKIEAAFERGDQRYYNVPCPFCSVLEPIRWRAIRWRDGDPLTAHLVCEHCDAEIGEHHKTAMLAAGQWIPTAVGEPGVRSYHLSSLYSPIGWYSWADAVAKFLEAKEKGPAKLKVWTNTVLAETWEERSEQLDEAGLFALREHYSAEVPAKALVLAAGVDVQGDRLELTVYGFGVGDEPFAIENRVLWGDPGASELWNALAEALSKEYTHESGHQLRIEAAAIDSGGNYTTEVYNFVRVHSARPWWAIKGREGFGRPFVTAPTRRKTGRKKRPVDLFTVGVDEVKSWIYSRLRATVAGQKLVHFPTSPDFDEEFFRQLVAEKLVTRYARGFPKREWVKKYPRNESLDCFVYALAALHIKSPDYARRAKELGQAPEQTAEEKATARRRPVRRRKGFATRW